MKNNKTVSVLLVLLATLLILSACTSAPKPEEASKPEETSEPQETAE